MWLGDFPVNFTTVSIFFTTHEASGEPVAPSSAFEAADVILYKNGSATQRTSTSGWTMTSPFDTITGLHRLLIDLSDNTDAGFYTAGSVYTAVLSPDETVDAIAVVKVIGQFGIDLLGVKADTDDIQTRLPAARVSGRMDSSVGAIAANVLTATAINADAITAAKVAADVSAEIADAVWDEDATGHQTQGSFGQVLGDSGIDTDTIWGLVNTNLDATVSSRASQTSVDTIDDFVDTEVAAILAAVDTEVAAIKAKTDQLTFTVANQVDANALTVGDKTGYRLSATGVDDLHDEVVEGTTTFRQSMRLANSANASKLSGAATTTVAIRDIGDTKDRITATVDASGNRTAIILDVT